MELLAILKRVIGLDVHQAQIRACAIVEEPDETTRVEHGNLARSSGIGANWRG